MQIKSKKVNRVFIALGSNLGDHRYYLISALKGINDVIGEIIGGSSFYETAPWGDIHQADFLNAVCEIETDLEPNPLLYGLMAIERWLGKQKKSKWGPRTIDLDIIYYDEKIIAEKDLIIPHPNMYLRNFVLTPMMEVAPDFIHPVLKKTTRSLLRDCPDRGKIVKTSFHYRP